MGREGGVLTFSMGSAVMLAVTRRGVRVGSHGA
jgi:hypothetical protein